MSKKKILKYFVFLVIPFLAAFLILARPQPARALDSAPKQEILNTLQARCYEPAKKQYDDKLAHFNDSAQDSLDFSQLPEFAAAPAEDQEAIAELKELAQTSLPQRISQTKEDFKTLAQINVNLASCYEKELTNASDLLANAKKLSAQAQAQLKTVENFNFDELFATNKSATALIKIPANETKIFRLRTFCLDSDRDAPKAGEEFYLATSTDELDKGLCPLIKNLGAGSNATQIQNQIWKTPSQTTENKIGEPKITLTKNIKTWGLVGSGGVVFLILLIWGIAKISTFGLAGKIFWPVGLVASLAIAGLGLWQGPAFSGESALIEAYRSGKIGVKAFSPGTISDLDIIITNYTNQDQEVDTACLFFVPAKIQTTQPTEESGGVDQGGIELVYSQRLASGGSIGDGPPFPPLPPTPEELAEQNLQKSIEEFKKNPNEETLQDVLDELSACQQVGCNEGSTQQQIADGWQGELDRQTQEYQNNRTEENRQKLARDVELGQAVGADTAAAEAALGL